MLCGSVRGLALKGSRRFRLGGTFRVQFSGVGYKLNWVWCDLRVGYSGMGEASMIGLLCPILRGSSPTIEFPKP